MTEFSEISEGTTKEPEKTEKILPKESLRVSDKLTITAIPLKRRPNPIPEYKKALGEVIKESDGVIFEYFPQETARLSSSLFLRLRPYREEYERVVAFFTPLADLTKRDEKPVYVFDPAYDEKFAAILDALPKFFATIGTSMGPLMILRALEDKEMLRKQLTRREFLKGLTVTGLGIAAAGFPLASPDSSYPSAARFRQAIVAKGISHIGENLDKNPEAKAKNLLLFYPPKHWERIKRLLKDKKELEREFKICSALKRGWLKNTFFTARKYEWTGKDWQLKSGEIGGSPGPTV